jgi:DNA-binding HxlR family transcriptional regulator
MTKTLHVNCSIMRALAEVGERWSLLIVREAMMGSARFDEFHERLGIARNILNDRLTALVGHGVLSRTRSSDNARIFLYRLTPKGLDLLPALAALMHWGDQWIHADIGPPIILVDSKSGHPIRKIAVIAQNGKPLDPQNVEIKSGPGATTIMRQRLSRRVHLIGSR